MSYNTNMLLATRQRSRLSHSDVKLILYLIVQIKPFKYVGDRTLSQSRKWDLIQQKFERYKLSRGTTPISVPTVRTLQRQMATALRKAQTLQLADPPRAPFDVFRHLLLQSLLADLERAVLELYNLSEAYKTGQTVGPLPDIVHSFADLPIEAEPDAEDAPNTPSPHASDLGDDMDVPDAMAPLLASLHALMDQNAAFYGECMAMMRQHSTAMAEKCAYFERLLTSTAELLKTTLPKTGAAVLHAETHADAPAAEPADEPAADVPADVPGDIPADEPADEPTDAAAGDTSDSTSRERQLGSLLVLLN